MASRHSFGLIAAGSVSRTLIGRLPARSRQIAAVAAVSFRVASRIANSLKAGKPVRGIQDLQGIQVLLFHAPQDQVRAMASFCFASSLRWQGKTVIFCDCQPPRTAVAEWRRLGSTVAVLRTFGLPGYAVIQGCPPAVLIARRIAREAGLRPLEIEHDSADVFAAAITLSTAAVTPLIDRTIWLLRSAGVREPDSLVVAERLFQQTIRGYAHSGRQSWVWHINPPDPEEVQAQLGAADPKVSGVIRQLLLLGFDSFDKHAEVAAAVRMPAPDGESPNNSTP